MEIPVNGDAFRSSCDHAFWHNASPLENPGFSHGNVVFCKIDEVWRLFRALRRTRRRIVLVTGEGDKPVTPELWQQKPPQVEAWFGTNMFTSGKTAHPLPLGLGNSGDAATLPWNDIRAARSVTRPREKLLYANFGTRSNPAVREALLQWIKQPGQAWITRASHSSADASGYLEQLLTHRFVLCPPGNGEDTHRMWEALYCGATPVVRKSPAMRDFTDLPILIVDDFFQLTPALLENSKKSGDLAKLNLSFWQERFDVARERVRKIGPLSARGWLQGWTQEIRRILRSRP